MSAQPLAPLDAAFLEIEGPRAHMHVGFAATLRPPPEGRSFATLRNHIAARLARAPRYRQRLVTPPFDLGDPVWVDDAGFDVDRHVLRSDARDLRQVVAQVMSVPLERDRPLWEIWIADALDDGRIGVVGKLHHCMVDGLAAVELATLLIDLEPAPPATAEPEPPVWEPDRTPGMLQAAAANLAQGARDAVALSTLPLRAARHPERLLAVPGATLRASRTVASSLLSSVPSPVLNPANSPFRHFAGVRRPLDELRRIRRAHGTTINDVVLAACADALGRFERERGEPPRSLRAMVPVNVRGGGTDELGNQISFMFLDLPCGAEDPAERLAAIHRTTAAHKERGEAGHVQALITLLGQVPRGVRRLAGHVLASPRTANLVVSSIPGPPMPVWLAGCLVEEAFPIVPLSDRHALSIGMLTLAGQANFGLYADRKTLPDVEVLAEHLDRAFDDLLATT